MKKNIRILILMAVSFLVISIFSKVNAASASISASKTNACVGDNVTITASVSGAASTNLSVSISNSKFVEYSNDGNNSNFSKTYKLDTSNEGTKTITLSGDITDENFNKTSINTSVTVNISKNNNSGTTKSSVATLKNLGIKPNDFSGFSAGKTSYSVTVPNDVESVELYATKLQDGQKITGTGNKTLKEGSNTFAIKVTAEDGKTTKTYTVDIIRQASAESTENKNETEEVFGLKELKVQGFDLTPEFKTDIYEYSVKLIGDQDKLDLSVLATEEKANVEITGNENLQEGDNLITITVVDESGEKAATYQVTVNKSLVDKDALAKHERNKMNIIIVCSITGLITITLIIIYLVKRKKSDDYDDYSYEKEIPYANLNKELEEEKKVQEDDVQEEKKEKKKHSKGKRFK